MEEEQRGAAFGVFIGMAFLIVFFGVIALLTLVVPSAADSGCGGTPGP